MNYFSVLLCCVTLSLSLSFEVKKGYFWQVTDFHYDANYSTTGDPASMCHKGVKGTFNNSPYGNYLCDAPMALVESAIKAMVDLHPKNETDFIIWTGDSVPHVKNNQLDITKVYMNIKNVTDRLLKYFPDVPIFPVLGNHDEYPADNFPASNTTDYYSQILSISGWDRLLSNVSAQEFKQGGFYGAYTKTGLQLLGLNTNLFYDQDPLTNSSLDPADQFKWLMKKLDQAFLQNKKVMLISHIAPGLFEKSDGLMWFYPEYNDEYVKILRRHSDVIGSQMYGHEHTDTFRILREEIKDDIHDGRPLDIMFLSPAVTPWKSTLPGVGANNPGIRLYQYNQENGEILNFWQYYLNLSSVIAGQPPKWQLEYEAQADYNITSLNPVRMYDLVKNFRQNDDSLVHKYLKYNSVSQDLSPKCDEDCVKVHFCSIVTLTQAEYQICRHGPVTTTPGVPDHSTRHPHRGKRPVPKYMEYLIIALAALVFVLFIVIAIMCLRKRPFFMPHKYTRFGSHLSKGPIN